MGMSSSYTSSIIIIIFIIPILLLITMPAAADSASCIRSCGSIKNISFPFSLNSSLSGVDPSFCPSSSYMDNPYFRLFCNHTEGKLYAMPDPIYADPESQLTRLEVTSIQTDSLIVRVATENMDVATTAPFVPGTNFNCSGSERTWVLLPPFGPGPYVISADNKFGAFGCTMGTIYMSDIIHHKPYDTVVDYYDHAVMGGCSVVLPDNLNNSDCRKHTCCVSSLPPASDLRLRYASYVADAYETQNLFGINVTDPECMCSKNYAALYHPNFTEIDNQLFQIKITWALPYDEGDLNEAEIMKSPHYACAGDETSDVVLVPEVPGYRCKCKDGFVGDGYASGIGCTSRCTQVSLPLSLSRLDFYKCI